MDVQIPRILAGEDRANIMQRLNLLKMHTLPRGRVMGADRLNPVL